MFDTFDTQCLDCRALVSFAEQPGDAVCPECGLRLYVTHDGHLGRYQPEGWSPGGIQGYHRGPRPGPAPRWHGGV
ncbi:MAG: hypothetical protein QOF30_2176 [Acidimicrobiaceae bacterium]|jgi:hypothetical protein|nr:hypothetical protein [Acidimicrobiaceae bacterium]